MNRVNIILTAYNGQKFIKDQIESIVNSYYANWKLWIFDDGSNDGTRQIIDEFIDKNPEKIHLHVNEKNKGVTRNFLDGILQINKEINSHTEIDSHKEINSHTEIIGNETKDIIDETQIDTQEYYMFCDQDDMWMPDKIDRTLKHMKKAEKQYGADSVLAVFTDAVVVDEHLQQIYPSFYKNSNLNINKLSLPNILMENKMIGCTVMFNEALKQKIKTIPGNVRYHDWWIALIASAFGHISYLAEPTMLYRQHSNNIVGNQNFLSYVKNRAASLSKQKEIIRLTIAQGMEFYQIYQKELKKKEKEQVYFFAHLLNDNWFMKRVRIISGGYTKTGFLRNLGLLLIV